MGRTLDEFFEELDLASSSLAHHGVKGMKWGVRKDQPQLTGKQKLMANPAVKLAMGTKQGNMANLAVTAASVAAVAGSAPVSVPLLIGGTVSARVVIKSYEAYKMFYDKHPAKILPKPTSKDMARYKLGQDLRQDLVKKHGGTKLSDM